MNKSLCAIVLLLQGIVGPTLCQGKEGDAISGMAAEGVVRLPYSGMVERAFGRVRGMPPEPLNRTFNKAYPRIDTKSQESSSSEKNVQTIEDRLEPNGQADSSDRLFDR